ncbi:TPA: hypothetical protein HA351_05730 [Methanosarcinaceae archaeon]|nr:hypothetical protein [Methanosarcinaceae archaeon]
MIYGCANFMEIPWETLIKLYRKKLGGKKFEHLENYAEDFIYFLKSQVERFPESVTKDPHYYNIGTYYKKIYGDFQDLRDDFLWDLENSEDFPDESSKCIKECIDDKSLDECCNVSAGENYLNDISNAIMDCIIDEEIKKCIDAEPIESLKDIDPTEFIKEYEELIQDLIEDTFIEIQLGNEHIQKLKTIASNLFLKYDLNKNEPSSGVVIAGFGEEDIFACLESYEVYYFFKKILKYRRREDTTKISYDNTAEIIPFAQGEMVNTFMAGIDPSYIEELMFHLRNEFDNYPPLIIEAKKKLFVENIKEEEICSVVNDLRSETLEKVDNMLKDIIAEKYASIMDVLSTLPKGELAEIAESLVNLTSFKRKITMQKETVAGPIDVSIISKSDGFIWIKRKQYFKRELNPHVNDS